MSLENQRPTEVMAQMYGETPESNQELVLLWRSLAQIFNGEIFFEISSELTGVIESLGLMVHAVKDGVFESMSKLLENVQESEAAQFLRTEFGQPVVTLAMPVFALLARKESEAQLDRQDSAFRVEYVLTSLREAIEQMRLALTIELVKQEAEHEAHQQAMAETQQIIAGDSQLSTVVGPGKRRLGDDIRALRQKVFSLNSLLSSLDRMMSGIVSGSQRVAVFQQAPALTRV